MICLTIAVLALCAAVIGIAGTLRTRYGDAIAAASGWGDTEKYGEQYIGGRGMAARIAWESIPPGVRALDPENLLMVFTGPLSGTTAPFSGRTSISGLSPQGWPHEWYSRSNLGGHWGPSLKYAGYDWLVIVGISDKPAYLSILNDVVKLEDAKPLWGLDTFETQKSLMKKHSNAAVLTIGPAGENLIRYAVIENDYWRSLGRTGVGAVMGSKKVKAIVFHGEKNTTLALGRCLRPPARGAVLHPTRDGCLATHAKRAEVDEAVIGEHRGGRAPAFVPE